MVKEAVDFKKIERKWQTAWRKAGIFTVKRSKRKKFYCLEMFPYPSGKLHMGHVRNYCIGDCIARFKRMQGLNVLYPMGFDAFGLPAENAAIERGIAPDKWIGKNIADMKEHLVALGFSYDWSRELKTCDPDYYALEQLFFLRFLRKGLAYRKKAAVNYCPRCQTVLANEQVHEGKCWRCDSIVKEKKLEQWFFKTTKYANELLSRLDKVDWPERVKLMQQNWIGKSQGADVIFKVKDKIKDKVKGETIKVFTTRPDTLFGATFLALSPEHKLVKKLIKPKYKKQIIAFLDKIKNKTLREREEKGKEGIFTGSYAINPVNNKNIPIYIAEYVLEYGTGAIMCVPAHDQRDYEFATRHKLPIVEVIKSSQGISKKAYDGEGPLINSARFNGIPSEKAKDVIVKWLAKRKLSSKKVNYKLKDWLISRQRYWGCPIPVVYCEKCGIVPVPEKNLPVLLPPPSKVRFGKGNPLAGCKEFINTKCPRCKGNAKRETDTMDTFVDSSWYFLKYCSKAKGKLSKEVNYWMPVDFYIGGIEHACMHLIYARFFTKVLADLGYVRVREPFSRLLCQGMVLKNGVAMSKSKGNVVSCDDMLTKYGADTIRLFELSSALPVSDLEWSDSSIAGSFRFLTKLYNLLSKAKTEKRIAFAEKYLLNEKEKLIQNTTKEIENLRLNIAISHIFIFCDKLSRYRKYISKEFAKKITNTVALLLCPFTPHLAEELWHLHNKSFAALAQWPKAKKLSKKEEKANAAVETVMADIEKIIKIIKKKPKKIYLYPTPKEAQLYRNAEGFFSQEFRAKVKVFANNDAKRYDPQGKASKAKVGKPAIYVE